MEASPLVQQARPSFQPKICNLYEQLFVDDEVDEGFHTERFWNELFVLRPDQSTLYAKLEGLSADDLLHFQLETQQLFYYALRQVKSGKAPSDENALETLAVFFNCILAKRYTNPSSDIITVLAGLDQIDSSFSEFASTVEIVIRTGKTPSLREKAVQAVLALVSGAYQTSLVSYFTHRDLFPALVKFAQDSDNIGHTFQPFVLLGVLANYNKFEYRNPYRLRMSDFVNQETIFQYQDTFGEACEKMRNSYAVVQPDVPESWNLSSALSSIGLGIFAPIKAMTPTPSEGVAREQFSNLPEPQAAALLSFYDFASANKLFCQSLFASQEGKGKELPANAFLSLTSYILHHAYRSSRASMYGHLNLITLRIVIEDNALCKKVCSDELVFSARLCRQRQPFLPPNQGRRPVAAHLLDIAVDAINHNLRRRLDVPLYASCLNLVHRILCCLIHSRTQFRYHWSFLWQSLLSLVRFLVTYENDLKTINVQMEFMITPLLKSFAISVVAGNSFLTPVAYDDLIYKLVENNAVLVRFKKAYEHSEPSIVPIPSWNSTPPIVPIPSWNSTPPIDILIHVTAHYDGLIAAEKAKGSTVRNLLPSQVNRVIRQGYESLEVPGLEGGLDTWEPWREGEERGFIKKIGRTVVDDVRKLVRQY